MGERRHGELRRQHVRVRNLRQEVVHKATTAIAKRSRLVCVESLHAVDCVRLVEVDRFYPSSKTCSACGLVNGELQMEERWRCPACGASHNRDDNAALNLRRQGLAADVEGVSDGRLAAVPGEASTRQIIPD